jgi:NAD(P)-dependent dehydrogenase (short-subunit alcohol dehydrogenase family)
VTGGGRGIGEAIARRFAAESATVVIAQRTHEVGERAAAEIVADGGEALSVVTDVTDESSVAAMVNTTVSTYGKVDILCNNAGQGGVEPLIHLTMTHYDAVMNVNVRGMLLCIKHSVPHMMERRDGAIINIASICSYMGLADSASYCASKSAVLGLSRQIALDCAPYGVRVNVIAPGFIETQMFHDYRVKQKNPETALQRILDTIPMGRLGAPDDVASASIFLASDEARWITGAELVVDGGTLCQ